MPFGPDTHAVAYDQHPHHQFRIDRGLTNGTMEGLQFGAQRVEIEEPVDVSEREVIGNVIGETEVIKQLRRRYLCSHHRSASDKHRTMESRTRSPINCRLNQHNRR